MNDSIITKTIMDLMRHAKISELESLDIATLRKLENRAELELEGAQKMFDWIEAITMGTLMVDDDPLVSVRAEHAVENASKRLQWISSIIDRKLGVNNSTSE